MANDPLLWSLLCFMFLLIPLATDGVEIKVGPKSQDPSSPTIIVPDGIQASEHYIELKPIDKSKYSIRESRLKENFDSGWSKSSEILYKLNYDPMTPVSGYYAVKITGELKFKNTGGEVDGGEKDRTFDASANVEVNTELKIGDSGYQDGKPWDANFTYSVEADLTNIKAYVVDGTEHTVVPDGSACQWKVNDVDAGRGTSLSAADFPSDFKDDNDVPEPGSYNVKAIYPDTSEVDQPLSVSETIKLVEVDSLRVEDGSDSGNYAETTEPDDPKTIYVPYTVDENGESTTFLDSLIRKWKNGIETVNNSSTFQELRTSSKTLEMEDENARNEILRECKKILGELLNQQPHE